MDDLARLWRLARVGFGLLLIAIAGVGTWIVIGGADPPRAGPLLWRDPLTAPGRWQTVSGAAAWTVDGVVLDPATDAHAVVLSQAPAGDYTFEVVAQPASGDSLYGLLIDWTPAGHSAGLINGNGFAHVYVTDGQLTRSIFGLAQWPWILPAPGANRLRVDVRGDQVEVRVNGEWLVGFQRGRTHPTLGLFATGLVRFYDATVWSDP